jgi:hypothetical protein
MDYIEVLKKYEHKDLKEFNPSDITFALNKVIPIDRENIPIQLLYENLAFDLIPNFKYSLVDEDFFKNRYGTLDRIIPRRINNKIISGEAINYWQARGILDINPLLKIHYLALVKTVARDKCGKLWAK